MDLFGGTIVVFLIVVIAMLVVMAAGMWKIFEKAGQEGWKCLIPIYANIVLLRIVGKPWWWFLLSCIPYIGVIWTVWQLNMLSKSFGKDEGFTVGLVLLPFVFFPVLGFGDAKYLGPYGDAEAFRTFGNKGNFDFEENRLAN